MSQKLTVKALKPRNPFVVAGLRRLAGSHRAGSSARRQQAERELRDEVHQAVHRPPSSP